MTKENYTTAIFVGCPQRGGPLLRSKVTNCKVISTDGHAGFAFNDRTLLNNCEVIGFRRAVFVDTGTVCDSHITNMDASQVVWALDLRGTSRKCGVTVKNSTFAFRTLGEYAQAIRLEDADVSGIHLENNLFMAPSVGKASKGRLNGPAVKDFTELNNRWVGGWEPPVIQARS
jgi:hypothetical protein